MPQKIENYVRAGYPGIVLLTSEETRALAECRRVASGLGLHFATWSLTRGLQVDGVNRSAVQDPAAAVAAASKLPDNTLYVLIDYHPFIKSPDIWRLLKDQFLEQKTRGITFVFLSAIFDIPKELERELVVIDLPLPSREELLQLLHEIAKAAGVEVPVDPFPIVEAALGLTVSEAENAFALSLVETGQFDPRVIAREKEQIVRKSGVLEIYSPDVGLDNVGGLAELKQYLKLRVAAFSPEAQQYGLPLPKGILLVGVPGCGKSLTAKALAAEWQKPLLRLDAGKLFGSFVGESESRTRVALQTAEAVAPAVLWIDEIEKGLAGVKSSGQTDSGVTARVFGTFLTWLQEKRSAVFVVATANDLAQLPPEFLRKGRFDEIFFVDLPNIEERKEIVSVLIKKYKRTPENFDIDMIASASEGYTGAEIEEAIVSGLFTAWNDGRRELKTEDIIQALRNIRPMSLGMADKLEALRAWAEHNARRANGVTRVEAQTTRVIRRKKQ